MRPSPRCYLIPYEIPRRQQCWNDKHRSFLPSTKTSRSATPPNVMSYIGPNRMSVVFSPFTLPPKRKHKPHYTNERDQGNGMRESATYTPLLVPLLPSMARVCAKVFVCHSILHALQIAAMTTNPPDDPKFREQFEFSRFPYPHHVITAQRGGIANEISILFYSKLKRVFKSMHVILEHGTC